jgi:sugar phosphate permease
VVGLLLLLTVRDPARGSTEPTSRTHHAKSLAETAKILFSQRSYVMLVIAMMLATFTAYSLQAWVPSFLSRVHHLDKAAVGFYAGFFKGLMGLFGILAGGLLTHQIIKRRPHLIGIVPVVSALLLPFAMMVFLHSRDVSVSLAALALAGFLIPAYTAPGFTMLHSVVPPSARAFATTVLLAVASLVGLGCGPLVVGFLSDLFTPWAGSDSLRYALILPGLLPFLTAFFFYLSARSLAEDEKRMPTL